MWKGRDDLFSDLGGHAQFGGHGMRSVFGHLLAPRGEQGLGLFLADQLGKELARITAIQNGNEVGTELGRNFLCMLWADALELFPGQILCDTRRASGNPHQAVSGVELDRKRARLNYSTEG